MKNIKIRKNPFFPPKADNTNHRKLQAIKAPILEAILQKHFKNLA